jgi:crotonobetainyl-CoA:carnitine CoA-transferase CaiB-like acyl-CoA transferase
MRTRSGSILPGIAPSNAYPCSDGDIVIGANQDKVFARFAETIAHPEWAEDPRFKTHHARGQRQAELDNLIGEWTRRHTVAEVDAIVVLAELACKSCERAGIFNASQNIGNICMSSGSGKTRGVCNVRQRSEKTRDFLLILNPSGLKVRAVGPCWKRSIRLKY